VSFFYFIDSKLSDSAVKLDSGFFCFSTDEFNALDFSGEFCFFKVFAENREEAIDFFDGKKEFSGSIGIEKVVK